MANYGYVRVSTKHQKEDRQLDNLKSMRIPDLQIFVDKDSGKNFNRPEWKKLFLKLNKGDCLYVCSVDRLGRNYQETSEIWQKLVYMGVDIEVLDMPYLTTRKREDLTNLLVSEIVLKVLIYVAEKERIENSNRIREGIASAKKRNVKFGRSRKTSLKKFGKVYAMVESGEITQKKACETLGISPTTFKRYRKDWLESHIEE